MTAVLISASNEVKKTMRIRFMMSVVWLSFRPVQSNQARPAVLC